MPGFMLHVGAVIQCTHAAPVSTAPSQPRVVVSGQPVATSSNILLVVGCPFQLPSKPSPCVKVQWLSLSTRVLVAGQPVLLQVSPGPGAGLCQSPEQAPQGPPMVASMQARVVAS